MNEKYTNAFVEEQSYTRSNSFPKRKLPTGQKFIWLIVGIVFGVLWVFAYRTPLVQNFLLEKGIIETSDILTEKKAFRQMEHIYQILDGSYFDQEKISASGMREWGLKWFVNAVDDPYTEYFTMDETEDFTNSLQGEEDFEWIGAAVTKKDEWVQIQEVYKWTPAALVGLQPLDMIMLINGEKTVDMTLDEAVDKIRWPEGTKVELTIFRSARKTDNDNGIFVVEPIRQKVEIPSVTSEIVALPENKWNACYFVISVIGDLTDMVLKKEITSCLEQNPTGIILDLRGNGWGYLQKWVDIATHFLPNETLVVSTKYSIFPSEDIFTRTTGELVDKPLVILVDALTASAGEIIAWALQQKIGAKLVWTTTFWKWSIQTVTEILDGAWLKYTIGKRYLPDGTNVDNEWIVPDIEVDFDAEAYAKDMTDNQKQEAIWVLAGMLQ